LPGDTKPTYTIIHWENTQIFFKNPSSVIKYYVLRTEGTTSEEVLGKYYSSRHIGMATLKQQHPHLAIVT
jgi:hypothetical protein